MRTVEAQTRGDTLEAQLHQRLAETANSEAEALWFPLRKTFGMFRILLA